MYKSMSNVGYIQEKLNAKTINKLNSYIKNKKNNMNNELAGNIENSFAIEDKNNWFFDNVLLPLIDQYPEKDLKEIVPHVLIKNCSYVLNKFWVNFQNKYEFNPTHNHAGVFSFIIWMEIPQVIRKKNNCHLQKKLIHRVQTLLNLFIQIYWVRYLQKNLS